MEQVKSNDNKKGLSLLWASRQMSMGASWTILGMVTFFCSNYLGLDTAIIGTLLLVSKIIDVISNFVIAYIVDNAHLRKGKGRPWELTIIPMWIMYVILYMIPMSWGNGAKYAAIFILYTLINAVCGTFLGCVDTIYFNHAVKNETTRIRVQAFAGGATMAMNLGTGILLPILMKRLADIPHGWAIIALIFAIPGTILGLVRYFTIPEVDTDVTEKQEQVSIKDTLMAFTSKYVIIITLMNFAVQLIGGFGSTVTYYFTYFVKDLDIMAFVQTASIVALATLFILVPLANKYGRTNVLRVSFLLCAIGCVVRASSTSVPVMYIGAFLASVVTYAVLSFQGLMLIDCMDYGDWKTGKRIEGAIFAGTGLGTTLGGGGGPSHQHDSEGGKDLQRARGYHHKIRREKRK